MKWIKAEGVDFKYIFPDDEIMEEEDKLFRNEIMDKYNMPLFRDNNIPKNLYKDIYKQVQHGDNTRLAIFKRGIFPETKKGKISFGVIPYCIVWNDNDIDLKELDKKVKNDIFSDQDFSNSIKTYIQRVFCFNCHQEYIGLVVDPGGFYIVLDENGNPDVSKLGLLNNKINKFNFKKCPNCNSPFKIYVAKILYKCEDKKFTY